MAINLAEKYEKRLVDKFYVDSVILGKTNRDYSWDGVKSINVYTILTQDVGNYDRTATSNRYGTPTEVEDDKQILTITQDKANSMVVDKGNNTEQMMIKNAGRVASRQIREKYIPWFDKYCLTKWNTERGDKTTNATLSKTNIVEAIGEHVTKLLNIGASLDDAYCYIGATHFGKLVLAPEYTGLEGLGTKAVDKGVVTQVRGLKIVAVPDNYLPSGVNFLTVKKSAVVAPLKIRDMNLHANPPGYSGHLLEFRWLCDAFVLETKKKAVIASCTS